MYMTPVVFITLAYLHCSRSSEDEESRGIHVQSAVDRVVDMVQSVAGYKPAIESTAGNDGSTIAQPDGPTESQSTAGVVTPDYAIMNPESVQSSGSSDKVTEKGCGCLDYIRDFCEG